MERSEEPVRHAQCTCQHGDGHVLRNGSGHAKSCPCYTPLMPAARPAAPEECPVCVSIRNLDHAIQHGNELLMMQSLQELDKVFPHFVRFLCLVVHA